MAATRPPPFLDRADERVAERAGGFSARTVEWHLHKVFIKLEIRSRQQLAGALPVSRSEAVSA